MSKSETPTIIGGIRDDPADIEELIARSAKFGHRKWWVPGVALPVSAEMLEDIRNNPDDVRITVRRKDGTTRAERPNLSYPAKGTSDHGLITGLIYWRGQLSSRWFEAGEDK